MKFAVWLMVKCGVPEALAGDLIEQGQHGRSAWWLWRQIAAAIAVTTIRPVSSCSGTIAAWALVIFVGGAMRILWDTFMPPMNYQYGLRSVVTTYFAVGTYLLIGCTAAFQTGRIRWGVSLALLSHVVGHVFSTILTLALFVGVIARDTAKLHEFQVTGGFGEVFFLPIMMVPFVAFIALLGGIFGRLARGGYEALEGGTA